jgi:DNA-binding HxlR family transcriptional regulator
MQENYESYNNILKAKEIGDGLFCSSRTVSGAMRKLITDGYVSKTEGTPTCYSLTELGMSVTVVIPEKKTKEEQLD